MIRIGVIGSGPAGCTAAIKAAQLGASVTLFERGPRGKDKACGDALVSRAITLLAEYGIDESSLAALEGVPFSQIDLWDSQGPIWTVGRADSRESVDGSGWIVRRAALDQRMRIAAEKIVDLRYETIVKNVQPVNKCSVSASFKTLQKSSSETFNSVVLATGASNGLARRLGIDGSPVRASAMSAYVIGGHRVEAPRFEFERKCRPGYKWIFPVSDKIQNVGVCTLGFDSRRLKRVTAEVCDSIGGDVMTARGGGGPLWSNHGERWHHNLGVVSCGDAGALVDPINGEGITAALLSGAAAGTACVGFAAGDPNALDNYSLWVKEQFTKRYHDNMLRQTWRSCAGLPNSHRPGT